MGTASSVQRSHVTIECQLCQGKNTIQWKCVNCQLLMCSSCKDNIHLRIAKDHKIINIKDIGELNPGESFNFSDIHCNEHSDQVCCSYCKICKQVVCVKCLMTVHNGHQFVDEEDFLSKKINLWEGQKRAVKKLEELSKAEIKLEKFKESEDAMYIKVKQDCQKNEATNQFSEILTELDVKMQSVYQIIDTEFRNLNREKGNFQEVINVVAFIKSTKDFCQFFEKFDELITKLNCDFIPCNTYIQSITDFNAEEHKVRKFVPIKTTDLEAKFSFRVAKQYTTDTRMVRRLTMLSDQTLLISDKTLVVQHVKIEKPRVQVISNFSIKIKAMAVSPLGDILISTGESRLGLLNIKTGKIKLSVYNTHPNLMSLSIHVTNDHRVIIGAKSHTSRIPVTRRGVVIAMDQDGNHLIEYEYGKDKIPLFEYPNHLTTTFNGNIFVVDWEDGKRGRVVVLGQGGDVIHVYSGNPKINTEKKPFYPINILTMCSGSNIVTDLNVNTLHILNYNGQLISFYNLFDIGIKHSYSLALYSRGHLLIGCSCKSGSPDTYKAKLYELEYFGI